MNVVDKGIRDIQAIPTGKPAAKAQVRVVSVGEKRFIKPAHLIEHFLPVKSCSTIGKQNLSTGIVLAEIRLSRPAAVIQAIKINEVTGFIDTSTISMEENLARTHSDARTRLHRGDKPFQPE